MLESHQIDPLKSVQPIMSKSCKENNLNKRKGRCRTFDQNQRCRFGDNCRYLHIVSENLSCEEASSNNTKPELVQQSSFSQTSIHDEVPVSNRNSQPSQRPLKTCHEFSRSGRCRYEAGCRYQHIKASLVEHEQKKSLGESSEFHLSNESQRSDNDTKVRLCNAFSLSGKCRFGTNCRFVHIPPELLEGQAPFVSQGQHQQPTHVPTRVQRDGKASGRPQGRELKGQQPGKRMTCRFFMAGTCKAAEKCKFFHPAVCQPGNTIPKDVGSPEKLHDKGIGKPSTGEDLTQNVGTPTVRTAVPPTVQTTIHVSDLTPESISSLRERELQRLKTRYPRRCEEEKNGETFYKFVFCPTDPDWPYDVKEVELVASFPDSYPTEVISLSVAESDILPETVRDYVEWSIKNWTLKRFLDFKRTDIVELVFRPFLKWLDKNLENIFTEGLKQYQRELMAKAAGIEFIPAQKLQEESAKRLSEKIEEEPANETKHVDGLKEEITEEEGAMNVETNEEQKKFSIETAKKGTEIKLQNFQLSENAATLLPTQIMIIVQCSRCRNKTDFKTPADRNNLIACSKCSEAQLVTFSACMAHQFSSVIGYLDMQNCSIFDLVLSESTFNLGCLNCNKEMKLEGLLPGQMKDTWCHHCHSKLRIGADNARYLVLQPAEKTVSGALVTVDVKKIKKVPKDPAIKEGSPLPNDGTCKHYKKSFRWLRFPCCGKAYPCDICHDDSEGDHEMKYANRMICGFCCKEQAYSGDKPCVACSSSLTKKSGSHWEGGKGCRDRIKMSRDDAKKYANTNKTLSRRSQKT